MSRKWVPSQKLCRGNQLLSGRKDAMDKTLQEVVVETAILGGKAN